VDRFDLPGHVYRMPSSGGTATALTQSSGVALNFQPRISPDGRQLPSSPIAAANTICGL
jgi:hypothetical protein